MGYENCDLYIFQDVAYIILHECSYIEAPRNCTDLPYNTKMTFP